MPARMSPVHHPIMFHFTCPGCAAHIAVADAARVGEPCSDCVTEQTWASMQAADQRTIDATIRRGSIAGLLAMRDLNPPILLPRAADLLAFRQRARTQMYAEPEWRETPG